MSFETLKTLINDNIKSGLPTGIRPEEEHNPVLQSIVNTFGQDYIYMGLATTSTSPSTDDNARMYITNGGGTYTNFLDDASNPIVVESGSICFLKGVSGTYSKDVIMDGESILDNTKLRINDNGSTLDLEAYHNSAWVSIGKFSYDGTEATYESFTADSIGSDYLSASSIVSDSISSDTMTINGAAPVSLKGLAGGMSITKQRQEQVGGDKIVNTAANSIAELSDAGVLGKAALVYAPFTSRVDYTDSLVPSHDYGRFDFSRSSSKNVVNKDGLLNYVPANTPSYEYDNGVEPYLLTEPASTNLITYPISFVDDYWSKSGSSIEPDSSTAGSELVTNGDFSSATGWNVDTDRGSIDTTESVFNIDNTSGGGGVNQLNRGITLGKTYLFTFTIVEITSGTCSIYPRLSKSSGTHRTAAGTYSEYIYVDDFTYGDRLDVRGDTGGTAKIDNVSVKEVQPFEAPKEKPSVGSELVTNGDFATDSDWTKDSEWTIGSDVATYDATGDVKSIRQSFSTVVGTMYLVSFDVTNGTPNLAFASIAGDALFEGGVFKNDYAVGSHSFYSKAIKTDAISIFGYTSGGVGSIDNVSVKEVTSWSGGGLEREAFKLVESDVDEPHQIYEANSISVSAGERTYSYFIKPSGRSKMGIRWITGEYVTFDLSTLTQIESTGLTVSFQTLINGWYRVSATGTTGTTIGSRVILLDDAYTSGNPVVYSYTGNGTSGIYIAYAQLEESSYASSLMLPTTEGSTTSRVADAITGGGNQSLFNSESGVLFLNIAALVDEGLTADKWIALSDGTSSSSLRIAFSGGANTIRAYLNVGGAAQSDMTYTIADVTEFSKVGFRYAVDDFSLWVNGVERATDTSGSVFSANTLNELAFNNGGGGTGFYGKTKALAVFDYLSDEEMETLTT